MKDLKGWLDESKENQRLFAQEGLILEVTEAIWLALEKRRKSKADLARSLETSKAHVTQLLGGGRNMTLRTLADIAYNLNFEPHFQLRESAVVSRKTDRNG